MTLSSAAKIQKYRHSCLQIPSMINKTFQVFIKENDFLPEPFIRVGQLTDWGVH